VPTCKRAAIQGQLVGDGQAPVNQSAGRPKGIRRVSEGYPKGLTGHYGGSAGLGLGWRRLGAGENGGAWIGQVAPIVHLLHDADRASVLFIPRSAFLRLRLQDDQRFLARQSLSGQRVYPVEWLWQHGAGL
jgi:hypothetical protein